MSTNKQILEATSEIVKEIWTEIRAQAYQDDFVVGDLAVDLKDIRIILKEMTGEELRN